MDESKEAKMSFIVAFFDELDDKIDFLAQLLEQGRRDEALTLCAAYLDGLSNWLSTDSGAHRNFSRTLGALGGEPVFGLVLPAELLKALPERSAPPGCSDALRSWVTELTDNEAWVPYELTQALNEPLGRDAASWISNEYWRGTVASAVYSRIRNPGTHWLGSAEALTFSSTTHRGAPLPDIGFDMLYRALRRIATHARQLSIDTNKWFGLH